LHTLHVPVAVGVADVVLHAVDFVARQDYTIGSIESNLARRAACLSLSQTNPAAAIERCSQNDADAEGQADFEGMFLAWAQSDLLAAGKWLDAQPANVRLDALRHRYVYVLARTDPPQALRMTGEVLTVPEARDEAMLTILHQWALQDLYAARQWVENDAPEELKTRTLAEIEGLDSYTTHRYGEHAANHRCHRGNARLDRHY
jgi:hypothetical protein